MYVSQGVGGCYLLKAKLFVRLTGLIVEVRFPHSVICRVSLNGGHRITVRE